MKNAGVAISVIALLFIVCGVYITYDTFTSDDHKDEYTSDPLEEGTIEIPDAPGALPQASTANLNNNTVSLPESDFLGIYTLEDSSFGTFTKVLVNSDLRTISTNALPNHDTGEFPNSGNPNSISAQQDTYTFPTQPNFTGNAITSRTPGVAINGIKFEPETAERATCSTGEEYRIEAIQDFIDLGLDFNNAHVQPTGAYHYHGASQKIVENLGEGKDDLVHVGFARDGHLMYYSKQNTFKPSYTLVSEPRTGSNCQISLGPISDPVELAGTSPDGTYKEDWVYDASLGDLDECNGITIEGQYVYLLTDDYPYISRCLKGEFTEQSGSGGTPPQGQRPPR